MQWSSRLLLMLLALVLASPLQAQEEPSEAKNPPPEAQQDTSPNEPKAEADESNPAPEKPAEPETPEAKPEAEEQPADKADEKDSGEDKPAEPKAGEESADKESENADKESENEAEPADEADTKEEPKRELKIDEKTAAVLKKPYPQNVEDLKLIQKQLQSVVEYATPATVSVRVGQAFGSAVIVSPDGLVLTAGHVVGRPGLPVTFIFSDGTTARGKTLGMYRDIDSGMMKITDPGPWPYVKMAKAKDIKTGQWVVAIGHPGGFDPQRTPPVRLGRVLFANDDVISSDCTLVGGDSGGPLYNMQGEVVGIHSRIGRRITDNFHVPISTYHSTYDRLVAGESWGRGMGDTQEAEARPWLGVTCNPREPECKLSEVTPNSPAGRAGLQPGDIVRKYNGKQVDSFKDLLRLVFKSKPGDKVSIKVLRGEETLELEVRIGLLTEPLPGSAEKPEEEKKDKKD